LKTHGCINIKGKQCIRLRQFAIIIINEELCKAQKESKEVVLIHELSHVLYKANKSYRTFIKQVYES
jgi:predicted metal-dependent hydrolase